MVAGDGGDACKIEGDPPSPPPPRSHHPPSFSLSSIIDLQSVLIYNRIPFPKPLNLIIYHESFLFESLSSNDFFFLETLKPMLQKMKKIEERIEEGEDLRKMKKIEGERKWEEYGEEGLNQCNAPQFSLSM